MNGTITSIPYGMLFKRYYCSKCGTILEREKTHRVVTKNDRDYYRYHKYGTFPRRDYDVYDHRFKCPCCKTSISFDEQCIIERIQKKYEKHVLSSIEIKENYEKNRKANNKRILVGQILIPISIISLFFIFYCISVHDKISDNLLAISFIFATCVLVAALTSIRKYREGGKMKINRFYSYKKESLIKKLHTFASHNKSLIEKSHKCYCFYCKCVIAPNEINKYSDEEETALCPRCGIDSVIPDSIDESLDEGIIEEMHDYWF